MKDSKITQKIILTFLTILMIFPMNLAYARTNISEKPSETTTIIEDSKEEKPKQEETTDSDADDKKKEEVKENGIDKEPATSEENTGESALPIELDNIEEAADLEKKEIEEELNYNEVELIEELEKNIGNFNVQEPDVGYHTNRYLKKDDKGDPLKDGDGYMTVVSEAWSSSPTRYKVPSYDIVLVFDQSEAANEYRGEIFDGTKSFLEKLDSTYKASEGDGHKIAILGYGRIGSSGERGEPEKGETADGQLIPGRVYKSGNYNTGYYTDVNNNRFISDDISWKEFSSILNRPIPTVDNRSNLNPFISPRNATVFFNTGTDNLMSKWNANASRLDVGLVLANNIIQNSKNKQNKKLVLIFSNAVATQKSGSRYNHLKTQVEIAAGKLKDNPETTIISIGKYNKVFGSTATHESSENFKDQMKQVASGDNTLIVDETETYKKQIEKAFDIMADKITQGSRVQLKDVFGNQFDIKESKAYKTNFIKYDAKGKALFAESAATNYLEELTPQNNTITSTTEIEPIPDEKTNEIRGNKLIIETKIKPKSEFLGGNNIKTNTEGGIYDRVNNKKLKEFPDSPLVNIPIGKITVSAEDKNIYLSNSLTKGQLATVKVGDNNWLDFELHNYGLDSWQTSGVDIIIDFKNKEGNNIETKNLYKNQEYIVQVKIDPKEKENSLSIGNSAVRKTGSNEKNIYVFKPEFTFKNSSAYYGEELSDYVKTNLEEEQPKWINDDEKAVYSKLEGTEPSIELTFIPNQKNPFKTKNNKKYINTKKDVQVDVTGKIDSYDITKYIIFKNKNNNNNEMDTEKFEININTMDLIIKKEVDTTGEPHVFYVKYKPLYAEDYEDYTELTIIGNGKETISELPVGSYKVNEDMEWSWRYSSPAIQPNKVTLEKDSSDNEITITNTLSKTNWLNHFDPGFKNIFGKTKQKNDSK